MKWIVVNADTIGRNLLLNIEQVHNNETIIIFTLQNLKPKYQTRSELLTRLMILSFSVSMLIFILVVVDIR